jgi:hypothetical protein
LDGLDQGYPTSYSGFGTASLVFPADVIVDACASRYCVNLLKTALIDRTPSPESVLAEVNAVAEKIRLAEDVLKIEMGKDERGRPIRIVLDSKQLEKKSDDEVLRAAIKLVQDEEDRNLNSAYQKSMENNLKRLRDEMSLALHQEISRIVNDVDLGLDMAIAFLQDIDKRITAMVTSFTAQRQEADARVRQQLDPKSDKVYDALSKAVSGFVIGRGGRIATARDAYINHHKSRLATIFDKNLFSLSLSLLAYLSDDVVRVRMHELETLRDKLQVAQDRLSRVAGELAKGKSRALSPLTYELTDSDDVNRHYAQYARDLTQELPRLFEENGTLDTWVSRSYEEVHDTLLKFGRSVFAGVRQVEIEQVIMDKRAQETPEVRLENLREDSIPFWNRDLTRMSDGGTFLETLAVIGVPNKDNTIYKEAARAGEVLSSTYNRHAVTVMTTRHGLTVYALQQFDDYKRRYERHRERQVSPVHCFDIIDTRKLKTMFALGQAFGYIKKEGGRFFIVVPDEVVELQEKIELGQGLRNALDKFISVTDHVRKVETLVTKHIRANLIGSKEAAQAYINAPSSKTPDLVELEKELKLLVRKYKEENLEE